MHRIQVKQQNQEAAAVGTYSFTHTVYTKQRLFKNSIARNSQQRPPTIIDIDIDIDYSTVLVVSPVDNQSVLNNNIQDDSKCTK